MKLTIFFLLISFASIAATGYSQAEKVTLLLKDAGMKELFNKVEQQTSYKFLYRDDAIENILINLDETDKPLNDILNRILDGSGLTYKILDNNLIVIASGEMFQQKVTGTVTDSKTGQAMPGVNVLVEGTTTGVTTDAAGKYSITDVNEKSVLVFSFIGYEPYRQAVGSRSIIDVQLLQTTAALDEVVVIGYGTARKADLTSAISSVSVNDFQTRKITSLEQGIQGLATGVNVVQTSGEPGGGISVRIRGASSLSAGNRPLYVIDGIPFFNNSYKLSMTMNRTMGGGPAGEYNPPNSGLASINPNDIESIQVLKDASATAIYGNRGANGVILITTKKGKAGQNKINFDMSYGWQNLSKKLDVLDAKDFITLRTEERTYFPASFLPPLDVTADSIDTDWQEAAYEKNAPTAEYNLSFSGGTQALTYYISGNYKKQEGIVRLSGFERRSFRANLASQINEKVNAGIDMTLSNTILDGGSFEFGHLGGNTYFSLDPTIRAYLPNGKLNHYDPHLNTGILSPIKQKGEPAQWEDVRYTYRGMGNLYMAYEPVKNLTFRSSIGMDIMNIKRNKWGPPKNIYNPANGYEIGEAFVMHILVPSLIWENRLNYSLTLNDNVFDIVAVHSLETHSQTNAMMHTSTFDDNIVKYNNMSAGKLVYPNQTSIDKWQSVSFVGRINYSYKSKYIASASLRADASSKFANKPWGYFPAFSAAWRLSEESFIKNLGIFNDLKLRAGFGSTGNDDIEPYQSSESYAYTAYPVGDTYSIGVVPARLPYKGLTWEKTDMTSGGIDMSVLEGRVSLTAEYFYKTTRDLLLTQTIPAQSGFTSMLTNKGKIKNDGFEIAVNSNNLVGAFTWSSKVNFSYVRNEVLDVGADTNFIYAGGTRIGIGRSLGEFWTSIYDGVFRTTEELAAFTNLATDVKIGDAKYKDLSGPNGVPDKMLNDYDNTWAGNPNPKYILSIGNDFSFKGFDLSVFINAVQGQEIMVVNDWNPYSYKYGQNVMKDLFDNRWTPDNLNAKYPRPNPDRPPYGSWTIYDGSYVKLQYVTLAYNLPASICSKMKVSGLKVYLTGQNLHTFTKYPFYDPEVSNSGDNPLSAGQERFQYPSSRTLMLGINLQL